MSRHLKRLFRFRGGGPPSYTPQPGDLVSVVDEDNRYAVMKILAVDPEGVHVRLYAQRFAARPGLRELPVLDTAPFGPEFNNPLSFGHTALSFRTFRGWQPELLCDGEIREDELDGYRMWQEAEGGYF